MTSLREEIEKIAFELYQKSGKGNGHDLDNWLEAERLVLAWHEQQKAEKRLYPDKVKAGDGNVRSKGAR
ncbi:MAG: DUF2934 domain-containing protein [Nitrospirae bacterium]|nr:DUF2934 domain-containing protein [Nitrospirota bacterium]